VNPLSIHHLISEFISKLKKYERQTANRYFPIASRMRLHSKIISPLNPIAPPPQDQPVWFTAYHHRHRDRPLPCIPATVVRTSPRCREFHPPPAALRYRKSGIPVPPLPGCLPTATTLSSRRRSGGAKLGMVAAVHDPELEANGGLHRICPNGQRARVGGLQAAAIAMVRGSLGKLASCGLSVGGKWHHHQLRNLDIHEYEVPAYRSNGPPLHFARFLSMWIYLF
jgi:hypothetical protein